MEAANQQNVITFFLNFIRSPEKKTIETKMLFLIIIDIKWDSVRDIDDCILYAVGIIKEYTMFKFRVRHLFSIVFNVDVVSVQLSGVSAIFMILQTIQHVG
jgi:hypothetical protein